VAQVTRPALYTLLAAHAFATRNRLRRELGRSGVWLVGLALAFFGTTFLLPLWGLMVAVGWLLGMGLPGAGSEALLGAALFAMSFLGGATSGAMGGAKQLTWESYKTYPVRLRAIFAAELLASAVDLMPIVLGISTLCVCAGVAIAAPRALWLLPLVFVEGLAGVLVVQLFVGALAESVIRRLRVGLGVLAVVVWIGIAVSAMIPAELKAQGSDPFAPAHLAALARATRALQHAALALPTTGAARSLGAWLDHRPLEALAWHLYPLAVLALLALASAKLLDRDASGRSSEDEAPEKLWTFRTPAAGLARLQFATIMDSRVGRFGLIVPLVVLALLRGPLAQVAGQTAWAVPGAFLYLSLVGNQFQLNQFGLDGHGVKALLLLPIDEGELWRGKARGLLLYQALQAALLAGLLAVLQKPAPEQLAGGVVLYFVMAMVQNAIGRATSVWMPRMLPRKSVRANATPIALVLVGLALSVVGGGALGAGFAALARSAPHALVPAMLVALAVAAVVNRALLPRAARGLKNGKEKLLAALG